MTIEARAEQLVHLLMRTVKRVRPSARHDLEGAARFLVSRRASRAVLNQVYNRLTIAQQQQLWIRLARLFHETDATLETGSWDVAFAGEQIALPLGRDNSRLDWELALSLMGHETEIKQSYEALLRSPERPKVFFDIGANYGHHTFMLARHGVRVVAFEPNPTCHAYFERARALNGFDCTLEPIALDDREGVRDLWFPTAETWLGSLDPKVIKSVPSSDLRSVPVKTLTLDRYIRDRGLAPDLLKVDTEGNEAQVLLGARDTLDEKRPLIIFECWPEPAERTRVFEVLSQSRYRIAEAPLPNARVLDLSAFIASQAANFVAAPQEQWGRHSLLR